MTDSPHDTTANQLEEQGDFLRGLARSLVTDEHEADDLVQETWLKALRGDAAERPRSWFRAVLHNLTREGFRKARRREHRERAVASDEALPSHEQVLERLEVNHRLALAVLDLPEPYRSTIHLHFFEQRSLREIAERTAVPWETVRSRLKRGLAHLRLRLDRDAGGDRARWLAALGPLAQGSWQGVAVAGGTAAASGSGAWTMGGMAAVLAIGVGLWAWSGGRGDELRQAPEPAGPPPIATQDDGLVEVTGHISVVDPDGGIHDDESGEFVLAWAVGQEAFQETVPVVHGRFTHRIPAPTLLAAGRVTLGGRHARLESQRLAYQEGQPLEVRAFWQPTVILRVVSAADRDPLTGLEVRRREFWRATGADEHPGENEAVVTVLTGASSPVELPGQDGVKTYWVRAPGLAWQRVDVDHDRGGEHEVVLSPGADLDVTLTTQSDATPSFVRLRHPGQENHEWVLEVPVPTEPVLHLTGLKPGRYDLSLEVGEFLNADSLGATEVVLVAGQLTPATLSPDPGRQRRTLAPVRGSLVLPPETRSLDGAPLDVTITLVDAEDGRPVDPVTLRLADMQEVPGERGHYRFDAGRLPPGVYVAGVNVVQYREKFRLHEAGAELRVEVPPLREVRLVLRDPSGLEVNARKVTWSHGDLPGVAFSTRRDAWRDEDSGEYWFLAPLGTVDVAVIDPELESHNRRLEVTAAGPNRLEIPVRPVPTVELRLTLEGVAVPMDAEFWRKVRVLGDSPGRFRRANDLSAVYQVPEPGEYRVVFPTAQGYAAIENQVLQVKEGVNPVEVTVRPVE